MGYIIDGGSGDIYFFELSDKNNNSYFFEIYAKNLQGAIKIAQKHFIEKYGSKATHLERNITGYPLLKIV